MIAVRHETLGAFFARKRAERRLSTRALAERAGVSGPMISQIETEWVTRPSFTTVAKLADALGVSLEELARIDRRANPRPRRRTYT